jgi:cytochrome oxidase Cu insertion factor (SCO1/SenC/PrrC family)
MRTVKFWAAAMALAAITAAVGAQAGKLREGDLKVGDAAADFTLKDVDGKNPVKLSELKGKPVLLIFGSCT